MAFTINNHCIFFSASRALVPFANFVTSLDDVSNFVCCKVGVAHKEIIPQITRFVHLKMIFFTFFRAPKGGPSLGPLVQDSVESVIQFLEQLFFAVQQRYAVALADNSNIALAPKTIRAADNSFIMFCE